MKVRCIDNKNNEFDLVVGHVYEVDLTRGGDAHTCHYLRDKDFGFFKTRFEVLPDEPPTEVPDGRPVAAPSTKDTNPKDAVGSVKAPISTISGQVLGEVGLAMLEGSLKYGRHNYRVAGVRASVYFDAVVLRHLLLWWEGQDIDPDSGLSHIIKAIAGLCVLRDSMLQGNWVDDRPPKVADQEWVTKLNALAKALIAKYPNPKEPFTQIAGQVKP